MPPYNNELWRDMPYIEEEMWENLPQTFKLYCKKICNENNYETGSEPTTPTTVQGRRANQAETVPTATMAKGKGIAINSLCRLSVMHEGVEGTTIMNSGANYHAQDAHVTGIAGNSLLDLPIVTGAALIVTTHGPVIGIFHQYA